MISPRSLIIRPEMLPPGDGGNINGPSVIRAPDWLADKRGRYYLYFAHHRGRAIRLAFSDSLTGPWTVYAPGTLRIEDLPGRWDHIASPDVHVDHLQRRIRMYFHGQREGERRQMSYVAESSDGIAFRSNCEPLADFYLRAIPLGDSWLGMTKGGRLWTSRSGLEPFHTLDCRLFPMRDPQGNAPGDVRHVALERQGSRLLIFLTRIGDTPEAIRCASVDLREPARQWRAIDHGIVLKPEHAWEGAALPARASRPGASEGPENGVRDPAVFVDADGSRHLLYSTAGESGIGITPLAGPESDAGLRIEARPPKASVRVPRKQVYVMGCARSGTWLSAALMSTFERVAVFPDETAVESFARARTNADTLVLKRDDKAYETVERIPAPITIVWIVRHPYDVLTSHNPTSGRRYHVTPHRWLGEMLALQYLVDSGRPGVTVVRYEDLVLDPVRVQQTLAGELGLRVAAPPDGFLERFPASTLAQAAMHGMRPIDTLSVGRYRRDPDGIAYLHALRPRLGRLLSWVGQTYGYDLNLPPGDTAPVVLMRQPTGAAAGDC